MRTIALFVCDPKCSVQSSNGIMNALQGYYNFKLFSKNEVEDNFFDNVDLIVVPGGFGDSDSYDTLLKHNSKAIVNYVKNNGCYLGICMGAYWAGKHYFNILNNVNAVQYIKRPKADTRRPHAKNINIKWNGIDTKMFFYDGCALIGNGNYRTVATYSNGDPMAIIQKNVGLIGCHPESEEFWYDSYSWLKGKYHNGEHHKLLLEFVNELINSKNNDKEKSK
jgi:glutamine amidotransferase-like uncharacterized protein